MPNQVRTKNSEAPSVDGASLEERELVRPPSLRGKPRRQSSHGPIKGDFVGPAGVGGDGVARNEATVEWLLRESEIAPEGRVSAFPPGTCQKAGSSVFWDLVINWCVERG